MKLLRLSGVGAAEIRDDSFWGDNSLELMLQTPGFYPGACIICHAAQPFV
jgi:hypothetical protein